MVQQFACPWHSYHFLWWSLGQNVDEVPFKWHLTLLIKTKMGHHSSVLPYPWYTPSRPPSLRA